MTDRLLDFTGKVVLITGGATGIGRATALAFARQGARVAIGDVSDDAAETVRLITGAGGSAFFRPTDVRKGDQVSALVNATLSAYGRMDCAFNNAGILPPTLPMAEMPDDTFNEILAVDLAGVFLSMKY